MRKQDNFDTTERAVIALIEHRSLNKAAAALAVHPVTLWRWLKMPHFREQLREAQHQLFSRELARLQGLASAAVDALEEMLSSPETPPSTRLHVAKYVLEQSLRPFAIEEIRLDDVNAEEPLVHRNCATVDTERTSEDPEWVESPTDTVMSRP